MAHLHSTRASSADSRKTRQVNFAGVSRNIHCDEACYLIIRMDTFVEEF